MSEQPTATPTMIEVEILDVDGAVECVVGNVTCVAEGLAAFLRDRGLRPDVTADVIAAETDYADGPLVAEGRCIITGALDWQFLAREVPAQ